MNRDLYNAAKCILKTNLRISPNEDLLIVCDEQRTRIADALALSADELKARATILIVTNNFRRSKTIRKPKISEGLKDMVRRMNVIIICLANIPYELDFRRFFIKMHRYYPVRVANIPGVTEETFKLLGDVPKMQFIEKIGNELAILFANGKKVRVTSPAGTDVCFEVYGWKVPPEISSGYLYQPSTWGNLPGAEVYLAPVVGTTQGEIVIDLTIDPDHKMKGTLRFRVINGRVDHKSIESTDMKAEKFLKSVLKEKNGDLICEFGIGLNPRIKNPMGITLIDEKILGTAHFALGDNKEFGGKIKSKVHYDMVFSRPSIWIDDNLVLKNGTLSYSDKQLKNSYKMFEGLLPEHTIVKPTPWATCVRLDKGLARLWRGGANRIHAYQLGDRKTSQLAEKIWSAVKYGGSTIKQISSDAGINDVNLTKKVIDFLVFHKVLEIKSVEEMKELEKLGKRQKYERIELLQK